MTPADFSAWAAAMKAARGWSGRRCARELGCSANTVVTWKRFGAPTYIALACAALAADLPPWRAGVHAEGDAQSNGAYRNGP